MPATQSQILDALLEFRLGFAGVRWNFPLAVGTPVSAPGGVGQAVALSFSFPSVLPAYDAGAGITDFAVLTAAQQNAARTVLVHYGNVANVTFTETGSTGDANLAFGQYNAGFPVGAAGYASMPSYGYSSSGGNIVSASEGNNSAGDVWIKTGSYPDSEYQPEKHGYELLLHEIGHAMGLKHPFEGAATLPAELDQGGFTVMAYNGLLHGTIVTVTGNDSAWNVSWTQVAPRTLMVGDMLALQYTYGANATYRTGADTYSWQVGEKFLETIWDGGGTDTIDASNQTLASVIKLAPGSYSSIGLRQTHAELYQDIPAFAAADVIGLFDDSELYSGQNNLGIAYGCIIENATGGSGNDSLSGNDVANVLGAGVGNDTLTGGLGADTLDGGEGLDTAIYAGPKAGYTVTRAGTGYTVVDTNPGDAGGNEGTDTLSGIEWLQFSDGATKLGRQLNDTSGDGKSDLMWRNSDGSTSLWLMNGTSVQTYGSFGQIPTAWQISASGDLNGDGKTDLLWRHSDGSTSLWLMNGTGVQSYGAFGQIPTTWQITTTGDFNGDGKTDLMWRHTDGSTSLWLMNGTTAQGYGSFGAIPTAWQITATADYNGDGKSDLMWRHTDGSTSLWLMNGTVAQGYGSFGPIPVTWSILDSQGDYNGDGKNDLLWRNTDGTTNLWLMNGTSVQTYGSFGQVATGWNLVDGHGDYNGDGKSDLMWRHSDGSTSLWLMNGTAVQTYGSFGAIPAAWSVIDAHDDYNSDGKSDILWRHSDGSTSLWLMNGTGVQTYGSFGQIPGTWNPVAGADAGATLSGDGGANSLTGTVNNDTLIGLAGNDTLTGGIGADRFVFNTALNAGTNVDTITDFSSGTDKILLDHLILTALTTGTLAASSFVAEAGATAHDGNDYLLYDTTTGTLAYDADGTGAQAAVLFATLTGHPALVAADLAGM
jgi:Ca2+-binding RTX toxin-like protein